jgi:beta-phosphoglucomutase
MKFKSIIFDFDGVLFDSERLHLKACNKVFDALGFAIPEDEYFQRYVGLSDIEMFPLILNDKNIECDMAQIKNLREKKINAYTNIINSNDSLDGLPNVKKFIELYEKKVAGFAICSGARREEIDAALNKLENGELKKYFKHIVTIDDVSRGKPSPEGYLLAARKLNMSPQDCLAIEDTPTGAAAAKAAGMIVVALSRSLEKTDFDNIDFLARSYDEIDAWISKNGANIL